MDCPHCSSTILKSDRSGLKMKARTRIVVLHKAGGVEFNCEHCGNAVMFESDNALSLKKANQPRLVVPKT